MTKLDHFIEVLANMMSNTVANGKQPLIENGLIVLEDSECSFQDIVSTFASKQPEVITLSNPVDDHAFIQAVIQANENKQWLIVNLECDPHNSVITALKQLSEDNEFTITDNSNQLIAVKLNPETRIVVCSKRSLIEEHITYPYFYNLFGPVLSI